ncbi:MAG: hypothetical protein MSH22_02505 [Spirochaetia bacterium]|nr:hypothetical protein [Spirochaetia bacterium]
MQFNINSIFLKSIFRYDGIEFIGAFRKLKNISCGVITTIVSQVDSSSSKGFFGAIAGILSEGTAGLHGKRRRRNGCARFLNFNIDE